MNMAPVPGQRVIIVNQHDIVLALDSLTSASIRCDAAHMAAKSLDERQRDALQYIIGDIQACVEELSDRLQIVREKASEATNG